ncbi:UNVERIFIED_CONTAM: hypothetical protein H355_010045 [Colinus virginianus]|nr:hypothetical protein H355_010045 [Colinus virginianus]
MARRFALFDLGGVLFGPGLQHFLGSYERNYALPSNFMRDVLFAGGSDSPHNKVMRGQITLSQVSCGHWRHFDLLIESCRVGLHKPDPRIYTYALEVLQAQPQEVRGHHRPLQLLRCYR